MNESPPFKFGGANIKGTPAMPAADVAHDLKVLKRHLDVFVVQEFRWPWYWRAFHATLLDTFAAFPTWIHGLARPGSGAQANFWRRSKFRKEESHTRLLHQGRAKISETRWIRGTKLAVKATGPSRWDAIHLWVVSTHFVVGADEAGDGEIRKHMLFDEDIPHLRDFLGQIIGISWFPVILEIDANIHRSSPAFPAFAAIIREAGGRFVGPLGVEYIAVFDGIKSARDGLTPRVVVDEVWSIPTSELKTDHEVRCITARIVRS